MNKKEKECMNKMEASWSESRFPVRLEFQMVQRLLFVELCPW